VSELVPASQVFDEARRVSARDVAEKCGAVLRGGGTHGWARARRCVLCDGRFDLSVSVSGWRCHKCGEHGDAIALWSKFAGVSAFEAACELAGYFPEQVATKETVSREDALRRREDARARAEANRTKSVRSGDASDASVARARRLWEASRPAANTLAVTYLRARGATLTHALHACERLRFHAKVPWYDPDDDSDTPRPACFTPALVAPVRLPDGAVLGVHLTHLSEDGRAKAALTPAKKMHGLTVDEDGRPGGVLLVAPASPTDTLVVGEGIENALAGARFALEARACGRGAGVFAALSLDRLQGGVGRGAWGGVDWRRPTPDPLAPAATIPHRGPVLVVVDHDMRGLIIAARTRFEKTVTGTRRAQVCAQLATHWWKAAGASDVKVVVPPQGADMTDVVGAA